MVHLLVRGNDMVRQNVRLGMLGLLFAVFVVAANAGAPKRLENREFGFSAKVPPGAVSCVVRNPGGGHRHGFSILLNPDARGCESSRKQSYIGLYGDYNVLNYKTPVPWLRLLCPHAQRSSETKDVLRLAFPANESVACEKKEKDGWIDVFIVAQAGKWPDARTSNIPYITYTAQLHTRRARFREDMRTFKRFLAGVKIFADRGNRGQTEPARFFRTSNEGQ